MKSELIPAPVLPSLRRLLARIVPLLAAVLLLIGAGSTARGDDYVPRSDSGPLASSYPGNGYTYVWSEGADTYRVDENTGESQFISATDTYWRDDDHSKTFAVSRDSLNNGTISGDENGVCFGNILHFNGPSTAIYGQNTYNLFGTIYTLERASYSMYADDDGGSHLTVTQSYVAANLGTLSVTYGQQYTFSGLDPVVGGFSGTLGDYGAFIFDSNRTAPSFAPSMLWVNSTLVTWAPGPITNTDGDITDHYSGTDADGNAIQLAVSGNIPNFAKVAGAVNPSVVVETRNGNGDLVSNGSGTYVKASPSYFNAPGWYIGVAQYSRATPFFLPNQSNLWMNGTRYAFRGGIDDGAGNSVDTYSNTTVGTLAIAHVPATTSPAVRVSYHGSNYTGTYDAEGGPTFQVSDNMGVTHLLVTFTPLGTPAYWVNGGLFQRYSDDDTLYSNPGQGQPLSLSPANGSLQVSASDPISSFSGSYAEGGAGIFLCTRTTGELIPAFTANADGTLQLDSVEAPTGFPPAIAVGSYGIWLYLGTAAEDSNPSTQAAYYGNAATGGPGSLLLKIRLSGDGASRIVTLTDYAGQTSTAGTYDTTTHLFQTTPGQLPVPMYGTSGYNGTAEYSGNNVRWGWLQPADGRPSTVRVADEVWGFTGADANGDHYAGYYAGQQITIDTSGRDGAGIVTLNDPLHPNGIGESTFAGTYYNNGFQLGAGSPEVFSGDKEGAVIASSGLSLSTTGADLDVLGNLFSLGSLANSPKTVGLTLSFSDDLTTAHLGSALSRPLAEWVWSHADSSSPTTGIPMMKLDSGNRLSLFDPTDRAKTAIFLNPDPAVGSRINGPLRIPRAGDLDMGIFTNGPKPDGSN